MILETGTVLQPGSGPIPAPLYLPASEANTLWGRLPCETDRAVLTIEPSDRTGEHPATLDSDNLGIDAEIRAHGHGSAEVAFKSACHRRSSEQPVE